MRFPFTRDSIVLSGGVDDRERRVLLTALFHLRIAHAEDAELGEELRELVAKLGGDYQVNRPGLIGGF